MLDALDAAIDRSPTVTLRLEPGQMVFLNNKTLLHNRKAFIDAPDVPKRHMVRVWLADTQ